MYESWASNSSKIDLSGYVCHNLYRTFQHRQAKRSSGGIALYYKESIKNGIQIVRNHFNSIIWLKLDHSFFKTKHDIYLCGIYLWNEESPAYDVVSIDFFDLLESDITHYDSLGEVYVCGDFNSRSGVKYDFVRSNSKNALFDNDDYVPVEINVRASLDTKCNRFGSKLLDLCKSTSTRIVNGRIGDDQGAFTFMSRNGASVVDYLLSKECNFSNITCFNVGSINVWSDHAPLYFSLSCNNILLIEQAESYTTYKWSQKYKDQFRANLIGQLPLLNQLVTNIEPTEAGIESVVCSFSNIVKKVADNYFLKHVNIFHSTNFVDVSSCDNTEWFDRECIDARNSYYEALRVFNCCKTDASRIYCCERKQFYKRLIKKKKRLFKYHKLNEIEELKKS